MSKKNKVTEQDAADIDFDPEYHEIEEDFALAQLKKTNPKLVAMMKNAGAEVDEEDESADQGST